MPASQDNAMSWILERMTEIDQGKIEEGGDSRYLTLPYLPLPQLTLPYLTLPYLTLPYLTLPYLTLPYFTLPYLTLPYLTLPYLTLPYPTFSNLILTPVPLLLFSKPKLIDHHFIFNNLTAE